jgi:DNA-binding IclR family transcriptional regulator
MARAAPGVERAIAVLNWLAAHPDQAFTLTDLVRGLDLNRATCHALLAALADAGYVYRDSAKAYRLGPALAAIGEIAHSSFLPIALVRDDMRNLSESLGLVCIAAGRVGLEMVILERAVPAMHLSVSLKLGARFTIAGPAGLSFMAWSPPADAEAWLDALHRARGEAERQQWAEAMATVRELGFCFGPIQPTGAASPPGPLRAGGKLNLSYVSAPVLNDAGEIIFSIALQGFDRAHETAEILDLGARLRAVCETARARIFGHGIGPAPSRGP